MLGCQPLHIDGGFLIYTIMAENKKSFNLYCDIIHTVQKLTDDQAGKLFKHILLYVTDKDPIPNDIVTEISFEPIKQSLKKDLIKYNEMVEKNRVNGRTGGRPKKNNQDGFSNNPNNPSGFSNNPTKAKKADNDIILSKDNISNGGWEKVIGLFPPTKHNGLIEAAIIWNNLEQKEKQSVMRHLNPYIKNTEAQFMKQIGNYFNERMWENMKAKPSSNKMKMLDYNFVEWIKEELEFERYDEARTYLAHLQVKDLESFKDLENEYKQLKNN
jgi:hypothetical protein